MSIICGINSSHLCPVAPCGFCQFLRVEAGCFQKRWLAGEKDACESCSLAGPTVLALGCLVLAKQFDARMGRFQPPVPQVLAPELIQSSLASWQFDSNQFHALFIYLGCSPSTAYNARKKRRGGWEIGSAVEKPPWRL